MSHAHDAHDRHPHGHTHGHEHGHTHGHAHAAHDHGDGHDPDGHRHAHAHDHDHGHAHGHAHAASRRDPLEAGAGRGKALFFDAPSGLSGDMTIAALVDLGVPEHVIADAVTSLGLSGFHLHFGTRERSGIVATSFEVHVEDAQPERTYATVRAILDRASLADAVKARALRTFLRLAEAEAKVHRMPIDDVHFHEVGAVDALVDVVGSAAALEWLGAEVTVSPLPMGRGFVHARHGILPLPPPAVVECLRGFATYDGGLDFEFVTPTGAAIVAANAHATERWPSIQPRHVGWGAGAKSLADRPNLLRVVLGDPLAADAFAAPMGAGGATHTVLEANLDDATGELVAACIETLLAEGALDAWATAVTMKKGRPAFTLSALTTRARADHVGAVLLRESTSIGLRRYDVARTERPRRIGVVDTPFGRIPVKVSEGPFGPPQRKPEFDVCAAAARAHGVPIREVIRAALLAVETDEGGDEG
jgi:uncharacterized protein (TIGR00299 family) protein